MSALAFHLRGEPEERLDLSVLVPARLAGMSESAIARLSVGTGRRAIPLGDVFRVRMGAVDEIRFEGGSPRLDRLGEGLTGGAVHVEGDAGWQVGRRMSGGRLTVAGSVGGFAGSGMTGGVLTVAGDAGDGLGAPLRGEMAGMAGGAIRVGGSAGTHAADRMRRGTIVVGGDCGNDAASRMIAGTLIVGGATSRRPGRLMKRGTLLLMGGSDPFGPTFQDNGVSDTIFLKLMATALDADGLGPVPFAGEPMRRWTGDTAVLGLGEIFCPL